MIDLHDWNNVSNTKIPLNEEIFALLVDRQDPKKLGPAVIVAKMMPAKSLTWTESKEGDALCYDVPAGNFYCCNGADIKYWKYINVPSEYTKSSCDPTKNETTIMKKEADYKKVNPLTTEVQKVDWLNNEINRLEDLLERGCTDAENVEYSIQMFRELLSTKMATCRANAVKKIKDNLSKGVAEFLKDFGTDLTDAEKVSIKSLTCLQINA